MCLIGLMASCTKDRPLPPEPTADSLVVAPGILKVNEFVAKGSLQQNEFGKKSDWFEIYNTLNRTVALESGRWYVTDNAANPRKYSLPPVNIPPKGFIVIWCDTLGIVATQIHASFGLNANGEEIGIYYVNKQDSTLEIDLHVYPAQMLDGYSSGRYPDGSPDWVSFEFPTPGASNQP